MSDGMNRAAWMAIARGSLWQQLLARQSMKVFSYFFIQNYQLDLPLDKCVQHLFRLTVLCLIKSMLMVFINRHEPSAWCWWNPLQTSTNLTMLNLAGLGNWEETQGILTMRVRPRFTFIYIRCWLSCGSSPRASCPKPYHNGNELELLQ